MAATLRLGCLTLLGLHSVWSGIPQEDASLAPGATRSIPVAVQAGQFLRVEVEVNGRDIEVAIIGPAGEKLAWARNRTFEPRPLAISVLAATPGKWSLQISLPEKSATAKASYRLRVIGPRDSTNGDEQIVAADKAFAAGDNIRADGTKASRLKAIELYTEALRLWQSVGYTQGEAAAHALLGYSFSQLGNLKPAQEHLEQALRLWQSLDDPARQIECLFDRGLAYVNAGDLRRAEESLQSAWSLVRPLADSYREALVLSGLGAVRYNSGDLAGAEDLYRQAATLAGSIGDRYRKTKSLDSAARVLQAKGEQLEALEILRGNLPFFRDVGDRRSELYAINSIGVAHHYMGHDQQALDAFSQALELSRTLGDAVMETNALGNVGLIHVEHGEQERALGFFNQSIALSKANHQVAEQARALREAGKVYNRLGSPRRALEYQERALNLVRDLHYRFSEAETRTAIGDAYVRLRQPRQAVKYYNTAIDMLRAEGRPVTEAAALTSLGDILISLGEDTKASDALHRALALLRNLNIGNMQASALMGLARIDAAQHRVAEATRQIEEALETTEVFRWGVAGSEQRSSFLARNFSLYESAIGLLVQLDRQDPGQGHAEKAFEISERARARSLLDLLGESRAEIRVAVDPELVQQEQTLRDRLAAKDRYRLQVLGGQSSDAEKAALDREIRALVDAYADVEARIRSRSPAYAALTQPQTLSLARIQQDVLDEDTTLLEYSLGDPHSVLWAVTKTTFTVYELPKRELIEQAARRAYQELSNKTLIDKTDALAALSSLLLGPVVRQLGRRPLVVVADGVLQYIPFSALPLRRGVPVSADHTVAYLPSASTLAVIRAATEGRQPAPKLAALLADPVYTRDDPRIRTRASAARASAAPVQTPSTLTRSAKDTGILQFERLYSTRKEAAAIRRLAEPQGVLEALDFQASRSTAISTALSQYRIVHFATHGLLNSRHPELSGLVLSLVTPDGSPANGFLQAYEVYNLKLAADLVVLSACQTALGKDVRGEGLLGLTRAFMYAGAPRVVASLWAVSDLATAELMKRFYRAMLVGHLAPATALRQAQESLRSEARWSAPYYWAGFTLQGEWR